MFISQDKLDLLARYMVATGKGERLISMLHYYEKRLERIKDEDIARGVNIEMQQDEPMLGMGC